MVRGIRSTLAMEGVINPPRQLDIDAIHLGKVFNTGLRQLL
jgi:hypothetical protein